MEKGDRVTERSTIAEFSTDFIAGLLGGSAGLIVGHPFDTVKVLLQTSKDRLKVQQCLRMVVRQEGPRGFFKGMAYPLASVGVLNSLFFGFNVIAESSICGMSSNRYLDVFVAGAIAGGLQSIPCTPVELVKVKLQTQLEDRPGRTGKLPRYSGPRECLAQIYQTHGLRGCFRGMSATMMRDVSGFSVYMTVYKFICDYGTPEGQVLPPFHTMLFAGGAAGVVSWALNFPIDTLKSLMQKDSLSNPEFRSTWHCLTKSCREQGKMVLWKGFGPGLVRAFPLNAVTLCTYDWTQRRLKTYLKNGNTEPDTGESTLGQLS